MVFLHYSGRYRVLPSFTEFYRVLPSFFGSRLTLLAFHLPANLWYLFLLLYFWKRDSWLVRHFDFRFWDIFFLNIDLSFCTTRFFLFNGIESFVVFDLPFPKSSLIFLVEPFSMAFYRVSINFYRVLSMRLPSFVSHPKLGRFFFNTNYQLLTFD